MNAKLGRVSRAAPFGPGVSQQAVGEKTKVNRRARVQCHADAFGAEARLAETNLVVARRQFGFDGPRGRGARDAAAALRILELEQDVCESGVVFIADVTDQHAMLRT